MEQKKYLKFKDITAYALGLFGLQVAVGFVNSYQADFYENAMGANIAVVGVLVLIAKAVSAFFDPIIGNLIDRTESKRGKLKPFILISLIPFAILTVMVFVKVPLSGAGLYVYLFVVYLLWCIAMTLGDVPSQGMAAVLTPNPEERTNTVSIANTLKSIGMSACFVIVPVVCAIVPGGANLISGKISATEYLWTGIVIAVVGTGLFSLIFFLNQERVPYRAERMGIMDMARTLKGNVPLMLVVLSYFLGFARQLAMGIQVQAAVTLLGDANKILPLGISTAIGTVISMALTPVLVKKFNEKWVFIGMHVYGFVISLITFFVGFGNIYLMLVFLFLTGLQFGAVNILPMVMVADSVDYYEHKTGKRTEGLAYALLSLSIKVSLAMGVGVGLILVGAFGYNADLGLDMEYGVRRGVYFTYTVVPGISSLLAAIPIFFYPLIGKKKEQIVSELALRRANDAENGNAFAETTTNTSEEPETAGTSDEDNNND